MGKTSISVNLAMAMVAAGKEVMLLDADLALANVDLLLGINPKFNLSHVINGQCSLDEAIVQGPAGLKIIAAASGVQKMTRLSEMEYAGLIRAFSDLSLSLDVLIVDTAPGIADNVTSFAHACQEVIVVVRDEPASIVNASALIEILSREYNQQNFRIVANMTRGMHEGPQLHKKLLFLTERFLDASLDYAGAVPYDECVRKAVQCQQTVIEKFPSSKAAQAFRKLAERIDHWGPREESGGQLQFFFERLLQQEQHLISTVVVNDGSGIVARQLK